MNASSRVTRVESQGTSYLVPITIEMIGEPHLKFFELTEYSVI